MRTLLALSLLVSLKAAAQALEGFPPSVRLPKDVTVKSLRTAQYDRAEFVIGGKSVPKAGRFADAWLDLNYRDKRPTAAATWAAWSPLLVKAGWKVVGQDHEVHTLQLDGPKGPSFLTVSLGDYADPQLTLVEAGTRPRTFRFPPPGPKVESVREDQDWPYLPALPGSKLKATVSDADAPMIVTPPGAKEALMVSERSTRKEYQPPKGLSRYELVLSVSQALKQAGWDVLSSAEPAHPDKAITAHYHKNGRDLWAYIDGGDEAGTTLVYVAADLGAEDWRKELEKACRVTLAGVTFDFDKATLRPESASALEKAARTLKSLPKLAVEVQGHTDNVGDEAYNAKLSEQRAQAVSRWLAAHGVDAARLSSQGYGKSRPVASNDTDAGRARNRRVELACVKHRP